MPGKVVFISYSHDSAEHREKVLGLAQRLRQDGVDAHLDQYVGGSPEEGWPRWMLDRLDEAAFVLVVCTETYYRRFRGHDVGKGATWEGALITQELYNARSRTLKFVPVLLAVGQEHFIPEPLRGHTHYGLTSEERYRALYLFLRGQAGVEPVPLGELRPVAKRVAEPLTFGSALDPPAPMAEPAGYRETRPSCFISVTLTLAAVIGMGALGVLVAPSIQKWLAGRCLPGEERTVDGIDYVRVCPGNFVMGSVANDPQAEADEKPAHQVTLSEFWLGKTEITNAQYRRIRPDQKGEDKLPATEVTWTEAKAACEAFGARLPTEAEWEYAARAGSQSAWSFGDDEKNLDAFAWYDKNSGLTPHPVGTKKANAWGFHDMHGNVWEWVADWYGPYSAAAQTDPAGPTTGALRVLRGGASVNPPRVLRSAIRFRWVPEGRARGAGFRCVRGPRRQH